MVSLQEAQALRRQVALKDKEAAERATLVTQDKLQRYTNRQPHRLQDVWMQPAISAKRKVPGNLDAHFNGFRCAHPAWPFPFFLPRHVCLRTRQMPANQRSRFEELGRPTDRCVMVCFC